MSTGDSPSTRLFFRARFCRMNPIATEPGRLHVRIVVWSDDAADLFGILTGDLIARADAGVPRVGSPSLVGPVGSHDRIRESES